MPAVLLIKSKLNKVIAIREHCAFIGHFSDAAMVNADITEKIWNKKIKKTIKAMIFKKLFRLQLIGQSLLDFGGSGVGCPVG